MAAELGEPWLGRLVLRRFGEPENLDLANRARRSHHDHHDFLERAHPVAIEVGHAQRRVRLAPHVIRHDALIDLDPAAGQHPRAIELGVRQECGAPLDASRRRERDPERLVLRQTLRESRPHGTRSCEPEQHRHPDPPRTDSQGSD